MKTHQLPQHSFAPNFRRCKYFVKKFFNCRPKTSLLLEKHCHFRQTLWMKTQWVWCYTHFSHTFPICCVSFFRSYYLVVASFLNLPWDGCFFCIHFATNHLIRWRLSCFSSANPLIISTDYRWLIYLRASECASCGVGHMQTSNFLSDFSSSTHQFHHSKVDPSLSRTLSVCVFARHIDEPAKRCPFNLIKSILSCSLLPFFQYTAPLNQFKRSGAQPSDGLQWWNFGLECIFIGLISISV